MRLVGEVVHVVEVGVLVENELDVESTILYNQRLREELQELKHGSSAAVR